MHVSTYIDWNEFEQELKEKYSGILNVTRLKNKAQKPVNTVKLEFKSTKERNEILESGDIGALHMKFKVTEYLTQASVLICSKCMGIGHFRKNCPQKEDTTCKTCGTIYKDQDEYLCSGVRKCIHYGEMHASNDSRCKVVKSYRAALTKDLLGNMEIAGRDPPIDRPTDGSIARSNRVINGRSYSSVVTTHQVNRSDPISEKLDTMMAKVCEEFARTRDSLNEIQTEMRAKYEETRRQTAQLEKNINELDNKIDDVAGRVYSIIQNICTAMMDPKGVQSANWKKYWQEQIKILKGCREALGLNAQTQKQ